MTIKDEIRSKVISMAQQCKGRNQIVYELNKANIQISAGSVSKVLREWKEGKSNSTITCDHEVEKSVDARPLQVSDENSISTTGDIIQAPPP